MFFIKEILYTYKLNNVQAQVCSYTQLIYRPAPVRYQSSYELKGIRIVLAIQSTVISFENRAEKYCTCLRKIFCWFCKNTTNFVFHQPPISSQFNCYKYSLVLKEKMLATHSFKVMYYKNQSVVYHSFNLMLNLFVDGYY